MQTPTKTQEQLHQETLAVLLDLKIMVLKWKCERRSKMFAAQIAHGAKKSGMSTSVTPLVSLATSC